VCVCVYLTRLYVLSYMMFWLHFQLPEFINLSCVKCLIVITSTNHNYVLTVFNIKGQEHYSNGLCISIVIKIVLVREGFHIRHMLHTAGEYHSGALKFVRTFYFRRGVWLYRGLELPVVTANSWTTLWTGIFLSKRKSDRKYEWLVIRW
jgi:hypothetical protein